MLKIHKKLGYLNITSYLYGVKKYTNMETEVQIHVLGLNPFGENFELNTDDIDEAIEYLQEIKRKIDEDDWKSENE